MKIINEDRKQQIETRLREQIKEITAFKIMKWHQKIIYRIRNAMKKKVKIFFNNHPIDDFVD